LARRSMSILDLEAWLRTTGSRLVGARLANVYQAGEALLLRFKAPGLEYLVVAEPGRRIHATKRIQPPPALKQAPLLALARKYLRGRRLDGVKRLGYDRIAVLEFQGGYRLVVELVPRGILALLDESGTVMAASRYLELRDRVVKPKQPYKPPPPPARDPLKPPTPEELAGILAGQRDVVRGLVRGLGLPGEAAEEAAHRAGVPLNAKPGELGEEDLKRLAETIKGLIEESTGGRGYLAVGPGILEAEPFKPTRLGGAPGVEVREYESIDEALDELFHLAGEAGGGEAGSERGRLEASLEEARRTMERYLEEALRLRKLAEAVASNYQALEEVVRCVEEARTRGGWGAATRCPGVREVNPGGGYYVVELPGLPEPLRVRAGETSDRVIVRLYAEAGEAEAKARRAREALETARERLAELELRARARRVQELARSRRREWYEKYHWIITRNGFLAIGGRDASQNESVVKRYLGDDDIFMHADVHGAPAVVVKAGGRTPPEEDLLDAAVIAAAYSKAWRAGVGSVRVYWAWGRQVSKSPPAGEYLARGAFMVYGRKNYLPPIPLRLAIGLSLDPEGAPLVIVGPEDLVAARSLAYVVLAPGDLKVEEAAEAIRESLARILPDEEKHYALGLPREEVERRIPGRSRILAARRGRLRAREINDY
jgi:predicted ribosome quality control (RQC) complex YloA/Tae2 family protein